MYYGVTHYIGRDILNSIADSATYMPDLDPLHDVVFRLLTWPLSHSPSSDEMVTIGLPLVMECFGALANLHLQYDPRVNRQCLEGNSELRWHGRQLGLPRAYVDWLGAESLRTSVNVLRIRVSKLEDGVKIWQQATGRRVVG